MTQIADAIIAGIASEDTALEQMSAIMVNLERAGYVIVPAQGAKAQCDGGMNPWPCPTCGDGPCRKRDPRCDCQQPDEVNGLRLISNSCPVHNENPDPPSPWPDRSATHSPAGCVKVQDFHVEYTASKGLSRISGWVNREDGERLHEGRDSAVVSLAPAAVEHDQTATAEQALRYHYGDAKRYVAPGTPAEGVTADRLALEIYRADSDNDGFEPAIETRMYRDGYLAPAIAILQKYRLEPK